MIKYGLIILCIILRCFSSAYATDYNQSSVAKGDSVIAEELTQENLLKLQEGDLYYGDVNAKIVVIEYDSLSCVHCAQFDRDIFPYIKENYIDEGLVLFIMRDFPLDSAAFYASILARCYANGDVDKFHKLRSVFFKHQNGWLKSSYKSALRNIAKLAGMDENEINNCVNSDHYKSKVAKSRLDAIMNFNVDSTPVFFINGKLVSGLRSVEYFDSVFKDLLQVDDLSDNDQNDL